MNDALPLWLNNGYDWDVGMWQESLDLEGNPTSENRRARVQGRQTYVFSLAEKLSTCCSASNIVQAGFSGIESHFNNENGMLRTILSPDGTVVDDSNKLYDQTFHLLALSSSRDLIMTATEDAEKLLTKIIETYRNPDGEGFVENCKHQPYQSNAHMHLFEAALSWVEACEEDNVPSGRWRKIAENIAAFSAKTFIDQDGGFLREFFNSNWKPKSGLDGTIVEPGHQFEWAWLFARWAKLNGNQTYLKTAKQLFEAGTNGINSFTGAAVNTLNERLEPVTIASRLWPQTEWLKASLVLFEASSGWERLAYLRHIEQAHAVLTRFLDTPKPGLWFDTLKGDNTFEHHVSPASSFYHIAGAIDQLMSTYDAVSKDQGIFTGLAVDAGYISGASQFDPFPMTGDESHRSAFNSFH